MATTSISGISSGIDWQSTIDLLMQIEQQSVTRLEERKAEYQAKNSAWSSIQSKLNALKNAAQKIDTQNEVLKKSASSSDTDVFTASAEAGAVSGSHAIIVNQLAQAEVYVHSDGWSDINSSSIYTGSGGQFAYNFDGQNIIVDVPTGSTLLDLVQLINNDDDNQDEDGNPLIVASTIDDGGDTDPIHLVLTAVNPTAANSFSIDDVNTNLGSGAEFDDASWTRTQDAQVSQIRVDGYPPAGWITRESNVIDDVLEGVTLTLKDTTASAVNVSVENNYSEIKQRITDWVNAYNQVMTEITTDTRYDSENEVRGILMGDSQVRTVRDELVDIVVSQIQGLPENASYLSLGDIGIDLSSNSTLTIDESELQEALEADAEAVANLFAKSTSTTDSSLQFLSYTKDTEGGSYEVEAAWLSSGYLDSSGTNTIGGYPATIESKTILVGQEGTPVEGMRIQFTYPGGGAGTTTATVRFGAGVGVQSDSAVKTMTDSIDGLIKNVTDSYSTQISNLDESIEAYEARMEIKREMLESKFIAMESLMAQAQTQSSWISAMG